MGTTSSDSGGIVSASLGRIAWQTTLTDHEDITPGLIPLEDIPFSQQDWPNPQRKPYIITTITSRLTDDGDIANKQLDWPNPFSNKKLALTWVNDNQNNLLNPAIDPVKSPISLTAGVNSKPSLLSNIGFVNSRPQYYTDLSPNNQYDWPVPSPKKLKFETWVNNLLQSTLAPIITQPPFNNPETAFVRRKPYIITDISSPINETPSTKPPINLDTSNPARKRVSALTWTQTRPFYYQDIKPFKQDNYPNPLGFKLKSPNTWISSRKIDEPAQAFMPCSVTEWDIPAPKRKLALTWISIIPQLQQLFTTPIGSGLIQSHPLRLKTVPSTWIQARPSYYSEPVIKPFGNIEWKSLLVRKETSLISHIQRFNIIGIAGSPFSQKDWPNPGLKKRLTVQWEFYYQLDDNLPPVVQSVTNPVIRKANVPLSWIYRNQIAEVVSDPNRVFNYPNPIILKRQNNGLVVSLLQSTLNPGVSEKPFSQTDYPNPQIGKRNFHSGITFNKPIYYTEGPLQPAQYDWPVFRPARRNPVGFIDFRLGVSEPPKFFNITEVPVRKTKSAESWIYSSLIDLTSILGLRPFSQSDWPIPLRARINFNILSILGQDFIILPNIFGRAICLISSTTEYYLISSIEDYDLESSITEYNLDSGGDECQ